MKAIYFLLAILYLLLTINYSLPAANAATPTPKPGEVGVKAEVKGPIPSSSASATPIPTTPAPKITNQQAGEPTKIQEAQEDGPKAPLDGAKAEIQEESKAPGSFAEEAIEQADNLLIKDNLWIILLGIIWFIFIAFIIFLFIKHRKTQTPGQALGETAPPGSAAAPSETRDSSPAEGSVKKTFVP